MFSAAALMVHNTSESVLDTEGVHTVHTVDTVFHKLYRTGHLKLFAFLELTIY